MEKLRKYFDFKLIAFLGIAYGFINLINFGKNAYLKINGLRFENMNWHSLIVDAQLKDWIIVMIFISFIAVLSKLMIEKKTKIYIVILVHLFFSFFIGIFIFFVAHLMGDLTIENLFFSNYEFDFNFVRYISVIDLNFLVYTSLVTVIYIYYYFNRMQSAESKKLELQAQLSKSQLSLLQSQLHPHFLFNTLNSIYSLMESNVQKSKIMMLDLSDVLRNVLEYKDESTIELQDELYILRKYINIKKTRFSDHLKIELKVGKGLENVQIPTMILQPLVENSIKHGTKSDSSLLTVEISITKEGEYLKIVVKNDGKHFKGSISQLMSKGVGLKNIIDRLKTMYDNQYLFKMSNSKKGVKTMLKIPFKLSESELV